MAGVKMEGIIDYLSSEIRSALEDAVRKTHLTIQGDSYNLYRAFLRAVDRKCGTWERVPDR